jgi:hypothetical protein
MNKMFLFSRLLLFDVVLVTRSTVVHECFVWVFGMIITNETVDVVFDPLPHLLHGSTLVMCCDNILHIATPNPFLGIHWSQKRIRL